MVRYYGYYSNLSCGKREKQNKDDDIAYILEPEDSSKEYRKIGPDLYKRYMKLTR